MMALGIPIYVCASASVPIAAGLIHLGASPGAALAFLIAGPATNAATITTVWKLLGRRTALLYLLTIAISAVGGGLSLDWLMPAMHAVVPPLAAHVHETMGLAWFSAFWAVLLLVVVAYSYAAKPEPKPETPRTHENPLPTDALEHRQQVELAISGMTCQPLRGRRHPGPDGLPRREVGPRGSCRRPGRRRRREP